MLRSKRDYIAATLLAGGVLAGVCTANAAIRIEGVELCGARTETCPPGFKTGDRISPPGGYVGGGLQMQTDLAISPSGDVWVMNNWEDIDSCFGVPSEVLSTRCGGEGVTIFFGMATPVRPPQIGPARALSDRYKIVGVSNQRGPAPCIAHLLTLSDLLAWPR